MSLVPDSPTDGGFAGVSSLCSSWFMCSGVGDGVDITAEGFGARLVGLFAGACAVVGNQGAEREF